MDLNHRSPGYEPDGYPDYPTSLFQTPQSFPLKPPMWYFFIHFRHCLLQGLPPSIIMSGRIGVVLLSTLLMCSMLAGCFGNDDSEQKELIELVVHYDTTNGTIQQSFIGGSQISFTGVSFSFDFARTTSDYGLETFTLDPGDGRSVISIDASESANIDVEYQIHGMYAVVLAATDINGNTANQTVMLRVEHSIEWSEANSADPDTMEINTASGNEYSIPKQLAISSIVENPETPLGSPVSVTWELTDPNSASKGTKTAQIQDGEEAAWSTNLNFPIAGMHDLALTIDQGQDRININHVVEILYEQEESVPNPYQQENESEEENSERE